MATDLLSPLPAELLGIIGQQCTSDDLVLLALTNKALNLHFTPALYTTLDIQDYDVAQQCIRTLSADPSTIAFGRDLAALVRSFALRFQNYNIPAVQKAKLARRLSRAVGRMTGLQHFALSAISMGSPNVCAAVARAAATTLRSLDIKPESEQWWADGSQAETLRTLRPAFSELTSFALALRNEERWVDFFEHILTSRAGELRTLKVEVYPTTMLTSLLHNTIVWARLEELELSGTNIPLATLPTTPNVRKLTLRSSLDADAPSELVLPPDAFPQLEVLSCPYQLLPAFLPVDSPKQRPIRTVQLNEASYDEAGGYGSYTGDERPTWTDVCAALSCLPRSAGPVTDLSFYVDWFDASDFGEDLAPFARTLERLLVVLREDPGREGAIATFGETLFAHASRLHTFLLSDAPCKADGISFTFAREDNKQFKWLEEWDAHTDALRKVAFTTEFMWTKVKGEWREGKRWVDESDNSEEEDSDEDEEDEEEEREKEGEDQEGEEDAVESDGSVEA